jgi:small subunit ribosomal protein S6
VKDTAGQDREEDMDTQTTPAAEGSAPAAIVIPPGTKIREYETNILLRPDFGEENSEKFRTRIRDLVAKNGGKVIKFSTWNRKKLSYSIQDHRFGVYIHVHFIGPSALVAELERNLRITDDVLRYLSVKVADRADPEKPVEADVKHAGDAEVERPPREERERRDEFGGEGDLGEGGDEGGEPETA